MAARLGLEPRYTVPETVVLPLDDLAAMRTKCVYFLSLNEHRRYTLHTIKFFS